MFAHFVALTENMQASILHSETQFHNAANVYTEPLGTDSVIATQIE